MGNVIFARPDYHYDSYDDFERLITVSGFPLIKYGEIDPASDKTYILTMLNGECREGWPGTRARIIHWNLEWAEYPRHAGVNETWSADRRYAIQIGAKYVPFGSHPDLPLAPLDSVPKMYDVATLMYYTNRRLQMGAWLRDKGVTIAPNGHAMERHNILLMSKLVLHIHQHEEVYTIAPQRFALAAAYKMPIISEMVDDKGIFEHSPVLWCDYVHLPAFVAMWKDDAGMRDRGEALYQLLCKEHTFRKEIEAAL